MYRLAYWSDVALGYWYTQVVRAQHYRALSENNRLRQAPLKAPRGPIEDRKGRVLVENVPSYNLLFDRSLSRDRDRSLEFASNILGQNAKELGTRLDQGRQGKFVPVVLQVSNHEDVQMRLDRKTAGERLKQKAIRLCQQAYEQGGLLSNCDLAELLSTGDSHISHLLADHERVTGQLVPRRATLHDVGTGLTHKRIICRKRFAEGKEPHVVAKETYHSLEAVDRYLGQYDRVRHCRLQGMTPEETAYTLNCSLSLVREYLDIDHELEQLHG